MKNQFLTAKNHFHPPISRKQKLPLENNNIDIIEPLHPICVVNKDCLDVCRQCDGSILLLNMANPYSPCGFPHLVGGQEEEVCRRSSLCHLPKNLYPIHEDEFIFTKDVKVNYTSFLEGYRFIPPFQVGVMTLPALKFAFHPFHYQIMKKKIQGLVQFIREHPYQNVILGAFGCGGFNNDPEIISRLFKECLVSLPKETKIIFAIKDTENHIKSNLNIFRNMFKENVEEITHPKAKESLSKDYPLEKKVANALT